MVMQEKKTRKRELVVQNRSGIHARVSTMIVLRCRDFVSDIRLYNGSVVADCRSVLDLLSLGASMGTTLRLEAVGEDAADVIETMTAMFEARFNEDEESTRNPASGVAPP
jgi:phosphotransferase system HPr (HPr) family protein